MKDEMEFILEKYGKQIKEYLGTTCELAASFFAESEDYVDYRESPSSGILTYGDAKISVIFFQDYSLSSNILTDFTYCKINELKFVKIITPFTKDRSYDLIIASAKDMETILKELRVRQMASNFKPDQFPVIGLDFSELKRNSIDFLLNEEFRTFCIKHRIPLKRGVVLEGKPGCGKTMSLRWLKNQALANNISFTSFASPREFLEDADSYFEDEKKIFVFEDFDTSLIDRERTGDAPNEILGRVLNVLEGVNQIHDTVSIFTTNKVNVFDSAFIRPGRIDKVITYSLPGKKEINEFFKVYLSDVKNDIKERLEEYLDDVNVDISYATLKGICDDINIFLFENRDININCALDIAKQKIQGANKAKEAKKNSSFVL